MLSTADLKDKGIPWSRQHISRLVKQRKFPAPVKIGANTQRVARKRNRCIPEGPH
jgi:prophage regulatory protein